MPTIDVIMTVILSGFIFYGLFFGLIRTLGNFLGVLIAAFLASRFYLPAAAYLEGFFFGYGNLGRVATFIVLFSLINRLSCFFFYLLDRSFDLISIIPFLKTFNRLGGALLGALTGSLVLGLFLFVAGRYAVVGHWFDFWLQDSQLAPYFLKIAAFLWPLLPEVLTKVKSLI